MDDEDDEVQFIGTSQGSGGGGGRIVTQIDFVPHHNVITETEQFFDKASQALAEFIDNSLQATNEEPSRKIDIILATERSSKVESCKYLVVLDNGCGMDMKELQEFATYSLDQVTKGKELKSGKSMISKFGVGAKNAGFYLGEKLCVITKNKTSTNVLELVLDKKGMDEKYREGRIDEVFRANVPVRPAGARSDTLQDCNLPDSLTREIRKMETGNSFTAVIVKLKPRHQEQICQDLEITKLELANIYHFYLNPNDLPDKLIPEISARVPTLKHNGSKPIESSKFRTTVNRKAKLDITVSVACTTTKGSSQPSLNRSSLRDCYSSIREYIARAKSAFRFNIEIPDPHGVGAAPESPQKGGGSTQRTAATQSEISPERNIYEMQGILFYYPHEGDSETVPSKRICDIKVKAETPDDEDADEIESSDDFFMNVFWAERLVPQTEVTKLPHLPLSLNAFQCEKKEIPVNWSKRVKGFLFFDAAFPLISNNKLRLLTSLDDLFTDQISKAKVSQMNFKPRNMHSDVITWIKNCHQSLDKEFKFSRRCREIELVDGCPVFGEMKFDVSGNEEYLRSDDKIKLWVSPSGKASCAKSKIAKIGILVGFKTISEQAPDLQEYSGQVKILYKLYPESVFGSTILDASFRAFDFNSYPLNLKPKKDDLKRIDGECPASIRIVTINVDDKDNEIDTELKSKDHFAMEIRESVCFGVQIMDSKKSKIVSTPKSAGSTGKYYQVSLSSFDADNNPIRDYGTSTHSKMWYFTPGKGYEERDKDKDKGSASGTNEKAYYFYQNISFSKSGPVSLQCTVTYDKNVVLTKNFHLLISGDKVHHMILDECEVARPIALKGGFPKFIVKFYDADDKAVNLNNDIEVCFISDDIKICMPVNDEMTGERPSFVMKNEPCIGFIENQWYAIPKDDKVIFPKGVFEVRKSLQLHVNYDPDDKSSGLSGRVCPPINVELTFIPGLPARIQPMQSLDSLEVLNEEELPAIMCTCYDSWGHITAPGRGLDWKLNMDYNGNFKGESSFPVDSKGVITLKGIKANVDRFIPTEGIELPIDCSLEGDNIVDAIPPLDFKVVVKSLYSISFVEVYWNDEPLPDPFTVEAGSVITGLSIKLFNDAVPSQEVEIKASLFSNASFISESWNTGRKKMKGKKAACADLTSIRIPTSVPHGKIDYSVDIFINECNFDYVFSVSVIPNPPTRWRIVTDEKDSCIVAGDVTSLSKTVRMLCLVDKFDNIISAENDSPLPILAVNVTDGKRIKKRSLKSTKYGQAKSARIEDQERSNDVDSDSTSENEIDGQQGVIENAIEILPLVKKRYSVATDCFFEDNADVGDDLVAVHVIDVAKLRLDNISLVPDRVPFFSKFRLNDEYDQYEADEKTFPFIADIPFRLDFISERYRNISARSPNTFEVFSFDNFPLKIKVLDKNNFPACFSHNVHDARFVITADIICQEADITATVYPKKKITQDTLEVDINIKLIMDKLALAIKASENEEESGVKCDTSGIKIEKFRLRFSCEYFTGTKKAPVPNSVETSMLQFVIKKINRVINLQTYIHSFGSKTSCNLSEPSLAFESCVLDGFPVISLLAITENGENCDTLIESFTFAFSQSGKEPKSSKKIENIPIENIYEKPFFNDDGLIVLSPLQNTEHSHVLSVGIVTVSISYQERRPNILAMISESDIHVRTNIKLKFIAGLPTAIGFDENSTEKLKNVTVTNSSNGLRKLGEAIGVQLFDKFGNRASITPEFKANYRAACRISRKAPSLSQGFSEDRITELPYLVRASSKELLLSESFDENKEHFYFPSIEICPSRGSGEGRLQLDFLIIFLNDESEIEDIEKKSVLFYFTSDEAKATKKLELRKKLDPLDNCIKNHDRDLKSCKLELKDTQERIRELLCKASSAQLKIFRCEPERFTQSECLRVLPELEQQLNDMRRSIKAVRKSQKRKHFPNPEKLKGYETHGIVTDLGFAEDYERAFILSWAASKYMDAVVVEDNETSNALCDNGVKSWALSAIIPYDKSKSSSRRLNLEPIHINGERAPGNPEYLVNVIELDPRNERFRGTIFYSIFGRSILFDDRKSADSYRQYLVSQRQRPPTIYSLDGFRTQPDGLKDPTKGSGIRPDSLEFVFGQFPSNNERELQSLSYDIETIKEINKFLDMKKGLQNKLHELESDDKRSILRAWRMEAQSLIDKLRDLGDSPEAAEEDQVVERESRFCTAREIGGRQLHDREYDDDDGTGSKRSRNSR